MRNIRVAALTALFASCSPNLADAKTYTISPDISSSYIITKNPAYAKNAGEMVAKKLSGLRLGDRIIFRTLGDYAGNKGWRLDITVSKKHRPRKVRATVQALISAIPTLVRSGKLQIGGSTNIIGFLDNAGGSLSCEDGGVVILLTDGQENSGSVDGSDLVRGTAVAPKRGARNVSGCSITMLGLGDMEKNSSLERTLNIRTFWRAFFTARGAQFNSLTAFQSANPTL